MKRETGYGKSIFVVNILILVEFSLLLLLILYSMYRVYKFQEWLEEKYEKLKKKAEKEIAEAKKEYPKTMTRIIEKFKTRSGEENK